jgi:hypothetical protein
MTDTTTPVTPPVNGSQALLERAWKVHRDTEELITEHSLRLIAQTIKEVLTDEGAVAAGAPTGRVRLVWEESAGWEVEMTEDGDADWTDVDDLTVGGYPSDDLSTDTVHFWETSPSLLAPYAEEGTLETDRTFGMLDKVIFTLDRMIEGPRKDDA